MLAENIKTNSSEFIVDMSSPEARILAVQPLSESEIDFISFVALSSGAVVVVSVLVLFIVQVVVASKTKLPGRLLSLTGTLLGIAFMAYEQYMGGNLEWVFGPIGQVYSVIGYSVAITVFSIGHAKMIWHIQKLSSGS